MSKRIVVNNSTGENSYLYLTQLSRLYCGYNANTTVLGLTLNTWTRFSYPSVGYTTFRNKDWTIDPTLSRFTYTGAAQKWFRVDAVCNIYKVVGGPNRNIEFQWYLNGVGVGPIRGAYMHDADSQIISGNGELLLSKDDYLEPYCRNIENGDDCVFKNCSFLIKEDPDYSFVVNSI